MTMALETINQYLAELGDKVGTPMKLHPTTCMLINNEGQVQVVITTPEESDLLILHRELMELPDCPATIAAQSLKLLTLNSQIETMQGCWFTVDSEQLAIHLMTTRVANQLDYTAFENLLIHFIELANSMQAHLIDNQLSTTDADGLTPTETIKV